MTAKGSPREKASAAAAALAAACKGAGFGFVAGVAAAPVDPVSSHIAVELASNPGEPASPGAATIAQSSAFVSCPGGEKGAHFVETRCQRAQGTQPEFSMPLPPPPPAPLAAAAAAAVAQSLRKSGRQFVELRVAFEPG
jgi:hypothetical protein